MFRFSQEFQSELTGFESDSVRHMWWSLQNPFISLAKLSLSIFRFSNKNFNSSKPVF